MSKKNIAFKLLLALLMLNDALYVLADDEPPINLSMIELMSNGENFDGMKVMVKGVQYIDFEANYLFYSMDSFKISDTASSVFLRGHKDLSNSKELKQFNGKYVSVVGLYRDMKREKFKKNEFLIGAPNGVGYIEVESISEVRLMMEK